MMAYTGRKFPELDRPMVCRKSLCAELSTRPDGLCEEHGDEQDQLRAAAGNGRKRGR